MVRHAVVAVRLSATLVALALCATAGTQAAPSAADTLGFVGVGGTLTLTQIGLVQKPLLKARRVNAFAWSPDGRRIAYTKPGGGLGVIHADGSGARALGVSSLDGRITWSPDARRIAYTAAAGQNIFVYTRTIGGGAAKVLTRAVPAPVLPSWSPRGTAIAFTSANTNFGHIYTVRPDGSGLRKLTRGRAESFPSWSPDGRLLMYQPYICPGGRCGYGIAVMRPDGSAQRLLAQVSGAPGGGGLHAAWSPDGRRVAFLRLGSSVDSDILVVDLHGKVNKVASDSRSGSAPAWSPDGRRIAYASNSGITLMNTDGSAKRQFVAFGGSPAWQPRR